MLAGESGDAPLRGLGQRRVGPVHVAVAGVAALARDLDRVQHARLRGYLVVRHIRVPLGLVASESAERLAVLDDVRDDDKVRQVGPVALGVSLPGRRREVQLAEARGEGEKRLGRDELAGDAQHAVVIEPRAVQGVELVVGEVFEVDAPRVGAQRSSDGHDSNLGVRHRVSSSLDASSGVDLHGLAHGFRPMVTYRAADCQQAAHRAPRAVVPRVPAGGVFDGSTSPSSGRPGPPAHGGASHEAFPDSMRRRGVRARLDRRRRRGSCEAGRISVPHHLDHRAPTVPAAGPTRWPARGPMR